MAHFYPRSPCGERRCRPGNCTRCCAFLSTLSLRRATGCLIMIGGSGADFYPRSPCGERLPVVLFCNNPKIISIHALLAESDPQHQVLWPPVKLFLSTLSLRRATRKTDVPGASEKYFYPRSPCGERQQAKNQQPDDLTFLSTLSLRRATTHPIGVLVTIIKISIHALLAESDFKPPVKTHRQEHFYPRSPCGERLISQADRCTTIPFLSTLSLRRATSKSDTATAFPLSFLSTLSLRRATRKPSIQVQHLPFLSTLSLRRATVFFCYEVQAYAYFYPRSPCGERPWARGSRVTYVEISIHALLAESDQQKCRDRKTYVDFYPRSPCGERPNTSPGPKSMTPISIHALLAESDK